MRRGWVDERFWCRQCPGSRAPSTASTDERTARSAPPTRRQRAARGRWSACSQLALNRSTENGSAGRELGRFDRRSANSFPEPAARVQPRCPCPVLTSRFGTAVGPMTGTPSAHTGRKPHQGTIWSESTGSSGRIRRSRSTRFAMRARCKVRSYPRTQPSRPTRMRDPSGTTAACN